MEKIPFNRPFIAGKELYYIAQAVMQAHLSGDGTFTKRCQTWMEEHFGVRRALLTHSCTAALEMAALLCDVGPGDEVIMDACPDAFIIGQGITEPGGSFGVLDGFVERYGAERILDSPIAENAVTGACIGAACAGKRPILVHMP